MAAFHPIRRFGQPSDKVRKGAWAGIAANGAEGLQWVESGYQAMRERFYGAIDKRLARAA